MSTPANPTSKSDKTETRAKTPAQGGAQAKATAAPSATKAAPKTSGTTATASAPANGAQSGTLPKVRITYVKSVIGYNHKQRDTIKSLGFHRLNQTVEHTATPEIRGMINRVTHLVRVEEVGA
jgi:large subunit ribosomal protein L30